MLAPDLAARRRRPLARLTARIADAGLAATVRKAFGDHVFRRTVSVVVEYRRGWRDSARSTALPDDIRMVVVRRPGALPPLCDWMAWRRAGFVRMLEDGKIGVFALRADHAVACAWISLADHRDRAAREFYRVSPGEAYHYCWMVDPALRRSTIAILLLREVMSVLAELGVERQFGVVDIVNRASYMIQYRLGYRECGQKVLHYTICGTRWTRLVLYTGTLGPLGERRAAAKR